MSLLASLNEVRQSALKAEKAFIEKNFQEVIIKLKTEIHKNPKSTKFYVRTEFHDELNHAIAELLNSEGLPTTYEFINLGGSNDHGSGDWKLCITVPKVE